MTYQIFLLWSLGLFVTTNWMLIWFGTAFPAHLFGQPDMESFHNYCEFKLPKLLGELFSCCICFSHWWSAAIASLICWYFKLPWEFIPCCIFTWPLLCFIILKKVDIVH